MAQTQATDAPAGVSVGEDPGAVQHVAPTQVTSPAVAATEDSSSPVKPDDKGGLDGSKDASDE
jgi:hypothetical protein